MPCSSPLASLDRTQIRRLVWAFDHAQTLSRYPVLVSVRAKRNCLIQRSAKNVALSSWHGAVSREKLGKRWYLKISYIMPDHSAFVFCDPHGVCGGSFPLNAA